MTARGAARATRLRAAFAVLGAAACALLARPEATGRAQTYVELDPGRIDLRDGGVPARIDWTRYEMVVVGGPMGGYILAPGHGPQEGFIGEVDYLTGGAWLGAVLGPAGIATCADIPTDGVVSGTVDDGGESVPLSIAFSPGTVLRPAVQGGAGETYAKRLVVTDDGETNLVVEITCADATGHTSVYVLYPSTPDNARAREVHFDRDEATGETRVDVAMTYPPAEHFVFRFHFADGVARFWKVRAMVGTDQSSGVAGAIAVDEGVAQVRFLAFGRTADNPSTFMEPAESYCFDLDANTESTECETLALAVEDPGQTVPISGVTHDFTIASVATVAVPGL